jgi:hypothetical protein
MNQQASPFRRLKILHLSLLAGITLFAMITVGLILTRSIVPVTDESLEQVLQGITAVISLTGLLVGFNLFKRKITQARNMTGTAEERMNQYRIACILWWALIEAPGFVAVLALYLSANYAFLALALFHMTILAVFMPRKDNIVALLGLTADEVARLEGK